MTDQPLASDNKYNFIIINKLVEVSIERYMFYIDVSRVSVAVLREIVGHGEIEIYIYL